MMTRIQHEAAMNKAADAAAAGSAFLAGAAWIAEAEPVITVFAALVAIVAGAAATWFHVEKALHIRAHRKHDGVVWRREDNVDETD